MNKKQILAELKKLMGKGYDHKYLNGRTIEQLSRTLGHFRFYTLNDNDPRIKNLVRQNCDTSFIK